MGALNLITPKRNDLGEPRWYVAHTRARHEKHVAEQLLDHSIESFLPLYSAVHRWKDRRKLVYLPLFPGYVFLRIALPERLRVLRLPGVVRFVGFNGTPAEVPDGELCALRSALENGTRVGPHPYLRIGRRVRIRFGPLQGAEGILIRRKGSCRLVLSIDLIMRSVAAEVDESDVEPIGAHGICATPYAAPGPTEDPVRAGH
jgi:transcription antitermination factor NusG